MFHSKRSQEGYLMLDHRNSPGITQADLLTIPASHRHLFQATKGLFESPIIRCCHCGTMVMINPDRTRARGFCSPCNHYRCDSPLCIECHPFNKKIDTAHEQAARLLNIQEL